MRGDMADKTASNRASVIPGNSSVFLRSVMREPKPELNPNSNSKRVMRRA